MLHCYPSGRRSKLSYFLNGIGADAWSLMYPSMPEKLQRLYDEGYKPVILTIESNIERWKKKRQVTVESKVGRLESFIKLIDFPIQVIATQRMPIANYKLGYGIS